MKRVAGVLLVVAVLLTGAVAAERALQRVERPDPLGRKLLYLPSAEMLRLTSLGNAGLVADVLYLWSIQYYAQYGINDRFLYLETVYDLITDLDPLYHDAYRVGALIIQLPNTDEEVHKKAVVHLFDKALRNMPQNHEIAEAAAWDMYIRYRDMANALRYLKVAAAIPGSPHRVERGRGGVVGQQRDLVLDRGSGDGEDRLRPGGLREADLPPRRVPRRRTAQPPSR